MADITEGHAPIDGGELWYWDTGGSGEPIVLMHAGTGSGMTWGPQRDVFAAAGYRVIGYSRRGHHRSSPMSAEAPGSGAGDLMALVRELDLGPFHAVALAGGGYFAVDLALSEPTMVRSLTIACSLMGITEPAWIQRLQALFFPEFWSLPSHFLELGPSYRAESPDGVAEWRRLYELAYDGRPPGPPPAERPLGPHQEMLNEITWAALARIEHPVLLIAGGADLILPPPLMEEAASHISGARFEVMPDAGHSAPWERPDRFNELTLEFIASV